MHFKYTSLKICICQNRKQKKVTVNITPSQPRVLQYNMEDGLRAVRIEANSSDESCMILAIQNIQVRYMYIE